MIEDIKKTLWATTEKLDANMHAAEYKHIALGLIFVKYLAGMFQTHCAELAARFANAGDDYFSHYANLNLINEELKEREYYKEVNVFGGPGAASWKSLSAQAKQAGISKRIDDALSLTETENSKLKGIFDRRYVRVQLLDGKLSELVNLVSEIGFGQSTDTAKKRARDLLGQIYEYFLGQFSSTEAPLASDEALA